MLDTNNMKFIWNILIFLSVLTSSALITSFTLLQCMIIINFGIPWSKYIEQKGILKLNNGIVKKYIFSLIFLLLFYIVSVFMVFIFFQYYLILYLFISVVVVLIGKRQTGYNSNNHSDWIKKYRHNLSNEEEDYIAVIKETEQKMISGYKRPFGHNF